MTFAQFNALVKRQQSNEEWQDFRAGLICSVLANIHRDPAKTKAFTAQDFMPERIKKHPQKQTPEEFLNSLRLMNAAAGGKEVEQ